MSCLTASRTSVDGLGLFSGPLWLVWAVLGIYVGGFGPLSEPMLAVLERSWGHFRGLGPHVGGLGLLLAPMLAVLAALGASVGGPGPSWAEKS